MYLFPLGITFMLLIIYCIYLFISLAQFTLYFLFISFHLWRKFTFLLIYSLCTYICLCIWFSLLYISRLFLFILACIHPFRNLFMVLICLPIVQFTFIYSRLFLFSDVITAFDPLTICPHHITFKITAFTHLNHLLPYSLFLPTEQRHVTHLRDS